MSASGRPLESRFASRDWRWLRGGSSLIVAALLGIAFAVPLVRLGAGLSPRTVFAVGVGTGGVLLALAQPRKILLLAIFLLPVVQVKLARGDLLLPIVIVATVVAGRAVAPWIPFPVAIGLIAFAALNAVSITSATNTQRAVSFMLVTMFLLLGAVWLSGILRDESFARGVARAYIWSCLFSAVIGMLALNAHIPGSNMLLFGGSRARAFFKDPNDFGSYLVPAAAIILEEFARPRLLRWRTRWLVLALIVLFGGIVESFSRDALLNVALASLTVIVVYGLRRNGVRGALKSLRVIVMCALAGLLLLAVTGSLNFFVKRSNAQSYDTQRFSNQAMATHEASQRILGHGPGQAEVLLPLPTHSLYVRAFFEEGIFGLMSVVVIFGGTLIAAIALATRDGDLHGIGSAALLGSWIGLTAASFFVDTVHWRLPYLLAGLVWASGAPLRRPTSRA